MNIVDIKQARDTLATILSDSVIQQLNRQIEVGITMFHEDKADENINSDLAVLGIVRFDDSLVDQSLYEDLPF
jgi:hypothetical protein